MHTNESSTVSDRAAARSTVAARVMSIRDFRRNRQLDRAVTQGEGQGRLAYVRVVTKTNASAAVYLLTTRAA